MVSEDAVGALGSLAQTTRLAIFRLLVQTGRTGLAAGDIAERLDIPPSSLSFHLAHLTRSGLVRQERQSRNMFYFADFPAMNRLVDYLLENCCEGEACEANASSRAEACR